MESVSTTLAALAVFFLGQLLPRWMVAHHGIRQMGRFGARMALSELNMISRKGRGGVKEISCSLKFFRRGEKGRGFALQRGRLRGKIGVP